MEQFLYQRPREKLRDRGARTLSNIELVQVIISSGSKGTSSARIAKNVVGELSQSSFLLYQNLLNIRGIGHAKASQVVAAIELGGRLCGRTLIKPPETPPEFLKIRIASKRTLAYTTVDGAGIFVQDRFDCIEDTPKAAAAIKKMFANAIQDYAESLIIGIGSRAYPVAMLDESLLGIAKMVFDTADLLEIKVNVIWLVNETSKQSFRRKALR